jgi:signal peptidase I
MDVEADLRDAVKRNLVADVARCFGQVRLQVTGTSMVPAVWPGDILTVSRCGSVELERGQIVLCFRDRSLVAHRVVRKAGNRIITRGDSLYNFDRPFREEEILGRVVTIVRDGRQVDPYPAWWHGLVCFILRRSQWFVRLLFRLKKLRYSARKVPAAQLEETQFVH